MIDGEGCQGLRLRLFQRFLGAAGMAAALCLALAACGGTPSPTLTPTPEPTSTPVPTATSTLSPTPAADVSASDAVPYVRLPQDEGAHLTPVEWWYFNGHLTDEGGRDYSYHFVTFQLTLPDGPTVRIAQLSWADHAKGVHLIAELPEAVEAEATSGQFDGSVSSWKMTGDGEDYSLAFQVGEYDVEMQAVSRKPAALHDGNGYVDLGIAGTTYYYSRTNLETTGSLAIDGESHRISGMSWMDHQWGDFTTAEIGWDWLSLFLDDGSELTVSVVWEREGRKHIETYGTYVPPGPPAAHLTADDITLAPTGSWMSEATGGEYPMGWELRVESLGLEVSLTPLMEDAEFIAIGVIPVHYWEGGVLVDGTKGGTPVGGKGFVEMTGYAPLREPFPTPAPSQN